jgi:hypothetical protein
MSELVFENDDKAWLLYFMVTRAPANNLTTNEFQ